LKKRLEIELKRLWSGEVAAVGIFWLCFFQFSKLEIGRNLMKSTVYPLFTLSLILVQGAFYWWILYKRLTGVTAFAEKAGQIYRVLKLIDIALLCLGLPMMILTHNHWFSTIIGIFILMFAFIEWVNYYKFRLSYNLNPLVLLRKLKNKTLVKSKLAKEIENG
jgi:hypothetical protein